MADTDRQRSLEDWYKARAAESPVLTNVAAGLEKAINGCRDAGFDYLIIDTPPSATTEISDVVAKADLCIIPVRPSPNDLRAVGRTVDIARTAKKPFLFVLNQVNSTARITLQASGALSKHGPVAETAVASRVGFAVSMTDGRTASEIEPNSKSAAEIADLWREIAGLLTEGKGA
jgi:chromosome partitioning protein